MLAHVTLCLCQLRNPRRGREGGRGLPRSSSHRGMSSTNSMGSAQGHRHNGQGSAVFDASGCSKDAWCWKGTEPASDPRRRRSPVGSAPSTYRCGTTWSFRWTQLCKSCRRINSTIKSITSQHVYIVAWYGVGVLAFSIRIRGQGVTTGTSQKEMHRVMIMALFSGYHDRVLLHSVHEFNTFIDHLLRNSHLETLLRRPS